MAEAVVQLLMETDVQGLTGAGRHERSGERTTSRNGYRDRTLSTRLGSLQLRIPKLRQGSHFPPFLERPLAGERPYLWLDATYLMQREGGRIVSVAAIIAVATNTEGRWKIVGLHIGPSEAEIFWGTFLKSLARRGLRGAKLARIIHDGAAQGFVA